MKGGVIKRIVSKPQDLLPMPPDEGPPLPRRLGLRWPGTRPPIIHEAITESPNPAEFMPVEVTSAFPEVARPEIELVPDEQLESQIKAAKTIEEFPEWVGTGWRVDIENWGIPKGATVADVLRFEVKELGNEKHLSDAQLRMLEKYAASDVIWVAKSKKAASEYLSEGMTAADITEYKPSDFGRGARIIDLDYSDGYLVMYGRAAKAAPALPKAPIGMPEAGER